MYRNLQTLSTSSNPSPEAKAKLTKLAEKIKSELPNHYTRLLEEYPQLEALGLSPIAAHNDPIWLPSRITSPEAKELGIEEFLKAEVQLRIGQVLDAINDLKGALSLRSFWSRHVKAQYDSQTRKTKGQTSLQKCKARVREAARMYTTCYEWLSKAAPDVAKAYGFQLLKGQDLVLLSDWLEGGFYKSNQGRLPWIWTLRPTLHPLESIDNLALTEPTVSDSQSLASALDDVVEAWRNEFIRLDFVHASAAAQRWNEEVEILRYEMVRIFRWFCYQALQWAWLADHESTMLYEDGITRPVQDEQWRTMDLPMRGFVAYACRKFSLYVNLANYASSEFIPAMGAKVWEEVWIGGPNTEVDNPNISETASRII
ncbi:hypothetical protein M407DRAFT_31631 [Tulasnella calospora MUT 4182]|uniref:Uncharacterized protein n=1 Tax=Tulasnella calospora MUT 4182 TaxID=1051891 RepID=A0A0C3LB34_9AGAM|nr:hypothetical protein M407DRAFT_31631 [Tulasnella calospora MUT 4182]